MEKRAEPGLNRDLPPIAERVSSPVNDPVDGSPPSEANTPLSSPADESLDIFSPNESVSSDITDDYGWDTPTKQRGTQTPPRLLSIPSLSTEDGAHGTASGDAAGDGSSDILDVAADVAADSSAPSETIEATNASIKKENNDDGGPGSTRIWGPYSISGHKGRSDQPDDDQSRRISFSMEVDMNFSNRRQSLRQRPKAKSDIRPESRDEPGRPEPQPVTLNNRPPVSGPKTEVALPDSPADQKPSIGSRKAQCGHSLASILPFTTRTSLAENQKNCVAIPKGTNRRCGSHRNLDVHAISKGLDSLNLSNIAGLRPLLEYLIPLTLCGSHQGVARHSLTAWFIDKANGHTADDLAEIREWVSSLKGGTSRQQTPIDSSNTHSTRETPKKTTPVPLPDPSSPIQNFQPYVVKRHAGKSVSQRLREVLTKPLGPKEINQSGLIYIFWYQGNFGHLKIGLTKNLDQRLRDWEKCGKPLDVHFPLDADDKRPVQHVSRVEKLIHTELKDHRLKETCSKCKSTHIEWFRVSKDPAVNVVRKWVRWMRKDPYIPRTKQDGRTEWVLDDQERVGSISDLCAPSTKPESLSPIFKKPHSTSQFRLSTSKSGDRKLRSPRNPITLRP